MTAIDRLATIRVAREPTTLVVVVNRHAVHTGVDENPIALHVAWCYNHGVDLLFDHTLTSRKAQTLPLHCQGQPKRYGRKFVVSTHDGGLSVSPEALNISVFEGKPTTLVVGS
jgi:hypothetical protein